VEGIGVVTVIGQVFKLAVLLFIVVFLYADNKQPLMDDVWYCLLGAGSAYVISGNSITIPDENHRHLTTWETPTQIICQHTSLWAGWSKSIQHMIEVARDQDRK